VNSARIHLHNGRMPSSSPAATASLIEYPCSIPVKVMGNSADGFSDAMASLALEFDPTFDARTMELRLSKNGNYLGITLHVWATSREQMDALYTRLTRHPMVKVAL
jgi:putative lipoic acid-binding regulatory protein